MNIYKNKFLSRFGLMHMIAANLCVWLNVLILETSHEIHSSVHGHSAVAVDEKEIEEIFEKETRANNGHHHDYGNRHNFTEIQGKMMCSLSL